MNIYINKYASWAVLVKFLKKKRDLKSYSLVKIILLYKNLKTHHFYSIMISIVLRVLTVAMATRCKGGHNGASDWPETRWLPNDCPASAIQNGVAHNDKPPFFHPYTFLRFCSNRYQVCTRLGQERWYHGKYREWQE